MEQNIIPIGVENACLSCGSFNAKIIADNADVVLASENACLSCGTVGD